MKQLQGRLRELENQSALRNGHSLDTLVRQARELVKHTGEIVRDLTAENLGSIIAEAVSQYGKEIVCNEAVLQIACR